MGGGTHRPVSDFFCFVGGGLTKRLKPGGACDLSIISGRTKPGGTYRNMTGRFNAIGSSALIFFIFFFYYYSVGCSWYSPSSETG